jgi:RecB family exonuclease
LLEGYEKLAPRTAAWKDDLRGETRVLGALGLFAESRAAALRPVAVEVSCKARIAGVLFAGAADLVYEADEVPGSYGILDFKLTDVEVRSQDPAERFLQCTLYYIGLPERLRRLSELVSVYVFDTAQLLTANIEESLIRGATQIVETALGRARGPDFPPTLNAFCPSCAYQALCPAYSDRQRKR